MVIVFFSANLLYVYNTSWKLDSVPLLVGNVQAKVTSAGDPKLTKKCLSQIRTWCNFVELGHLVPKQGSPLIDPKKYLQLLLGLMAKIDLTLGPVKLNTTVRHLSRHLAFKRKYRDFSFFLYMSGFFGTLVVHV